MKQWNLSSFLVMMLGLGLAVGVTACTTYVEKDIPDDDVDIHVEEDTTPDTVVVPPPAETPDVNVHVESPATPAPATPPRTAPEAPSGNTTEPSTSRQ